jgi:hypothetical protein
LILNDYTKKYLLLTENGPNNSYKVSSRPNRFYETEGQYGVSSISPYSAPLQYSPKPSSPVSLQSTSVVFSKLGLNLQNNHLVSKFLTPILTYTDVYLELHIYIRIQFYCSYLSHYCKTQRHSEKNILLE